MLHKALVILASTNLNEIVQRVDLCSAICIVLIASCFTGIKRKKIFVIDKTKYNLLRFLSQKDVDSNKMNKLLNQVVPFARNLCSQQAKVTSEIVINR